MGNCGFGLAPTRPEHRELILRTLENVEGMAFSALQAGLGDDWEFDSFSSYMDRVEARGMAINLGALVGHTPVRLFVMGEEAVEREASEGEIAAMVRIVASAVSDGALGFATSKAATHMGYGGYPVPSRLASLAEIQALAGALARAGRGVLQATIGRGLYLREFEEIARKIGRPISWTALLAGATGPGDHVQALERTVGLQRQGLEIVPQVSCRPLVFEFQFRSPFMFETLSFFRPVSAADLEGKARIYADASFRAQWKNAGERAQRWDEMVIASCSTRPELEEQTVGEAARRLGEHPVDLALDLALETDLLARFRIALMNTDEDAVGELLTHPSIMLGLSDAGAHASQLCDAGFATHLLGHWVREREVLTLEQAVRLLTGRAADVFGIADRGWLAPGLAGDVVVFDPATVGCGPVRRVHDLPGGADRLIADAHGMRAVIVNGQLLREDGRDALDPEGALPGRFLRGGAA
jgi:N-acyl-D-aspartate/D-glutamate deacylase